MEVNEAIRNLEILPDYFEIGEPVSFNNLMAIKKESAEIIELLKLFQISENKLDQDNLIKLIEDMSEHYLYLKRCQLGKEELKKIEKQVEQIKTILNLKGDNSGIRTY